MRATETERNNEDGKTQQDRSWFLTSRSQEQLFAYWVRGGLGGEGRERRGILPCRGQLEKGVRCSCVGLLGTGDPAGVTAGKRGTGTPRAHRAHDLTGQLMGCKRQGGREANDKSPWEGRKAMTFFHIHLFYSLVWTTSPGSFHLGVYLQSPGGVWLHSPV